MIGLNNLFYGHFFCNTATCMDGDIRLIHGNTEYDGLVEVCFNQRWGTVNGNGWSSVDTQVACRQLGYPTECKFIHA